MFGKRKQLQERAEDLIISCRLSADVCNETDNFGLFMDEFTELLANAKELCEISRTTKLKGITGDDPCEVYKQIQKNAQLSIQDALKRNCDKLIEEIKNDKSQRAANRRISSFKAIVKEHEAFFDGSTSNYALLLVDKLENIAEKIPKDLPISKDADLLMQIAQDAINAGISTTSLIMRRHKLDYKQAEEAQDILTRCGILMKGDSPTVKKAIDIPIYDPSFEEIIITRIEDAVSLELYPTQSPITAIDMMEGHDFEFWCADLLKANGFTNVEVTRGSGDQGVDILAEKDDVRYAIQCKCYSSDLGNTPVQEVYAGKTFYDCQIGAVMTNRFFTSGAKELAQSNGVLLWDRNRLMQWMETSTSNQH